MARHTENVNDGKGGYTDAHTKVGMYKPNAYGLYDMHGNVWEQCLDWGQHNLGFAAVTDPKGPASGIIRIWRGASHGNDTRWHRSSTRIAAHRPDFADTAVGFRVAIHLDSAQAAAPLSTASLISAEDEKLAATCAEFKAVWENYKENVEKINAEFQPKFENVNQQ